MTTAPKSDAAGTMKRNGKSFWFASLFLPRRVAADAARLYAFCRTMDDLADIAVTEENRATLTQVRKDLQSGVTLIPDLQDFFSLAKQYKLPCEAADFLIATFIQDATTELQITDEAELVRYCYGVAGTVGLMMAPILGADRQRAGEAAVHLGIAMQMTNIARDVLEDARNHRRYLPGSWVQDITSREILVSSDSTKFVVAAGVARLLDLADHYYASAALGFRWIPGRARRGIEVAAAVYREIGTVIRHNQYGWWKGRVSVSLPRKLWITALVYLGRSPVSRLRASNCADGLSQPLVGLPGAQ